MDREFYMRNLWRWSAGLPELDAPIVQRFSYSEARENWFPDFVRLMHNRMTLGIYRYGDFRSPTQPNYDRVSSALKRIGLYQQTGNGEHLIDAANLLGIEFTKGAHPAFHFTAADDGIHVEIKQ